MEWTEHPATEPFSLFVTKHDDRDQIPAIHLQSSRRLYRLLQLEEGQSLCAEFGDDVSVLDSSGRIILLEQVTNSVVRNLVANRSTKLWNTFTIWLEVLRKRQMLPDGVKFVLATDRRFNGDIFADLLAANTRDEALKARKRIQVLHDQSSIGTECQLLLAQILAADPEIFAGIVTNFSYEYCEIDAVELVRRELKKRNLAIPDRDIPDMEHSLRGWVDNNFNEKHKNKLRYSITYQELRKYIADTHSNRLASQKRLIYRKSSTEPGRIEDCLRENPRFVQQLDLINISHQERAINQYLLAIEHKLDWAKDGLIDDDFMQDYYQSLTSEFMLICENVELEHEDRDEIFRGQRRYFLCLSHNEPIKGLVPPKDFTTGCYHQLANTRMEPTESIGWHPAHHSLLEART